MPYMKKSIISQYFKTLCKRQLKLNLSPINETYKQERLDQNMPPKQPPRPGLELISSAGREWEIEKYQDLETAFSSSYILGKKVIDKQGRTIYTEEPLQKLIADAKEYKFILQPEYNIRENSSFEHSLKIEHFRDNYSLNYGKLRPDIIQVLPPNTFENYITPDGDELLLPENDKRLQLRVIDIKLTAEPSVGYFAEVAYYMMTLAGWLADEGLDEKYVVTSGAIWPGSHEDSNLYQAYQESLRKRAELSVEELNDFLIRDLEIVPISVFSIRLRKFLKNELKEVFEQSWREIAFHISKRCKNCEYLGYSWKNKDGEYTYHQDHCMRIAINENHLSQIANISQGATDALREKGINNIVNLSEIKSTNEILDNHQSLKAKRTVIPARAQSLISKSPITPGDAGTSAIMPKWSDLDIFLSVNFDISSGITASFGLKAVWKEPKEYGDNSEREIIVWPERRQADKRQAYAFIVDRKNIESERRELITLLQRIKMILNEAQERNENTTIQFYIWDDLEIKHLKRVIGRHLSFILSDEDVGELTWLFPPETILPNYNLERRSPITTIKETINSVTALPIPYYYSLLQTVRIYHTDGIEVKWFNVHPLFEDELSDQIPSERIQDIWNKSTKPNRYWFDMLEVYSETVMKRISALEEVTKKLRQDLYNKLSEKAPKISNFVPSPLGRVSFDGQLWYAFSKLDEKMKETEVLDIRAMPLHEREAKFYSAHLLKRIIGKEEADILRSLSLKKYSSRRVYELGPNSRAVKIKEGDFSFALSPEGNASFLNRSLLGFVNQISPLREHVLSLPYNQGYRLRLEDVLNVSIAAINVDNGFIVVDSNLRYGQDFIEIFEEYGLLNFGKNLSIDPLSKDYFTNKLKEVLQSIGNPSLAIREQAVIEAMGLGRRRGARRTEATPIAEFLWDANNISTQPSKIPTDKSFIGEVKSELSRKDIKLTDTQWDAWRNALRTRLQLIWGPPGTGKSRTLRSIIIGSIEAAKKIDSPLRILATAQTYTAIDNVLIDVYLQIKKYYSEQDIRVVRLRSEYSTPIQNDELTEIDMVVNRYNPSEELKILSQRLANSQGTTIVGATPEQVFNLIKSDGNVQAEYFDFIMIDEASQMDVAHAILSLNSISSDGSLVLAGDPKQLSPIHQAEPPVGLEAKVGSIYNYYLSLGMEQIMLDINFRSNKEIVNFAIETGYRRSLTSNSPDLKLNLLSQLTPDRPDDWPSDLFWNALWNEIIDPDKPIVSFVYPDGKSSQWNDFEVESIASLIQTIYGKVGKQVKNEIDSEGEVIISSLNVPYSYDEFWKKGIGVVTPHRAQQSKIVSRLKYLFGSTVSEVSYIRDAVDTVERFQGQERDIMIASFALGDVDMIANEEEFLLNLNRFNVMVSRARAKLIVFVTQEVIDYLANDIDVLHQSSLLKKFAETYLNTSIEMKLGYYKDGNEIEVNGLFKYRK